MATDIRVKLVYHEPSRPKLVLPFKPSPSPMSPSNPTSPFTNKPLSRVKDISLAKQTKRSATHVALFWHILPSVVTLAHILISPYTKVEEPPTLHAVHDILKYGVSPGALSQYDHVLYPGPVPRSFIPALFLATIVRTTTNTIEAFGLVLSGLQTQTLIRATQAVFFCLSFNHLTTSLHHSFSPTTSKLFVILSMSQFHIPYYAGRTLPNFTALPLAILSFSLILRNWQCTRRSEHVHALQIGLGLLAFASTLLRLEIAPIAGTLALLLVCQRKLSFSRAISAGVIGGCLALVLSSTIDTYFYASTIHTHTWWPELSAAIFNIIEGKSSDWGVSPWYYYIARLPRLLMGALPLTCLGIGYGWRDSRNWVLIAPTVIAIAVMSLIGHKEWRFIVYVVPLLNVLAAMGATRLWECQVPKLRRVLRAAIAGAVVLNIALSCLMTYISRLNYPGGEVGSLLDDLSHGRSGQVWLPAATLHAGTTLFTFPTSPNLTIHYPESAYLRCSNPYSSSLDELYVQEYAWVVTDVWAERDETDGVSGWNLVGEVDGFLGVEFEMTWPYIEVHCNRKLVILEREQA